MSKAICEMTYEEASEEYVSCMKEAFRILDHSFKELYYFRDRAEALRLYVVENFLDKERGRNAPLTETNAESVQIKEEFT